MRHRNFLVCVFLLSTWYSPSMAYEPPLPKDAAFITVVPSMIKGKTACDIHDKKQVAELWNRYAGIFDYKDWQYAIPDAPVYTIELHYNQQHITLINAAPAFEGQKNTKIKSFGLTADDGSGEDPAPVEVAFRKKLAAFSAIMKKCVALEKVN